MAWQGGVQQFLTWCDESISGYEIRRRRPDQNPKAQFGDPKGNEGAVERGEGLHREAGKEVQERKVRNVVFIFHVQSLRMCIIFVFPII